jgi:CcmD family protein
MGVELLFIVSVLVWLGIFLYLLALHVRQRKLRRMVDRLCIIPKGDDEDRGP